MSTTAPLQIYTIGHSDHTLSEFVALLRQHRIAVLLDVRSAPYSRWVPHFNKATLEVGCKEAGIDYRYAGQVLGGRPEDPDLYKDGQTPDAVLPRELYLKRVDYLEMMQRDPYRRGVARLVEIARELEPKGQRVTVMCSEGDPLSCHRHHLIARSLVDPTVRVVDAFVEVWHLLRDGSAEAVDPAVFEEPPQQNRLF
ncbi:MAG: DUF488 domain-containing protein [Chloroflexi bacterium]|nr:DUF488 domain-containing protein [Chloroflexota bacterium]